MRLLGSTWDPIAELAHLDSLSDKGTVMFEEVEDRPQLAAPAALHPAGWQLKAITDSRVMSEMNSTLCTDEHILNVYLYPALA